ncbi:hypothetical protein [Bradyrhizobium jicamae]|nr:hypothetical protein [Bradyrhizobium jicamae]
MRHMITGMIAVAAVMATAPAMACGFSPCAAPVYSAPVVGYGYGHGYGYGYGGCNPCGGLGAVERLPDPDAVYPGTTQQYYYVNQGPTYTGPGNWAPHPYYREGYGRPYYGHHHYGYHAYHHYRPHYGYGYHYGHPVLRRYY